MPVDPSLNDGSASAELLAHPRIKYLVYFPVLLAFAAFLLWAFPTDGMTAVASLIGTVVGCVMIWEFLFTVKVIRFSTVCALGLVMGYGFGTLNTWLTLPRSGFPLAVVIGQTVPELADGVAAALMGCAVLLCLGELFEKPVWTKAQQLHVTEAMKRLVLVNTVIITAAFATGKFEQGGIEGAGVHGAGVVAEFLEFLFFPTVIMATVIFLVEVKKRDKYLFGVVAVLCLLFAVTQGRVPFVSTVLIIIVTARYFGYRWSRLTFSRVLLVGLGLSFLFVGVVTYQLLRIAGGTISDYEIGPEMGQVQRWVEHGEAWKMATASSAKNLQRRTLLVTFMSSLLYHEETQRPALGRDLILQIEWAIPSVIFPDKPTIAEENLASQTFHVYYPDQSNSIFTAGALDFGVWGVMLYPFFTVMLCSIYQRTATAYFSYEVVAFGNFMLLRTFLTPELQLTAYFGAVRNLFVFTLFLYAASRVPRLRFGAITSRMDA